LQRLNRVEQPRRLAIGRELQIPLAWMPQVATVAEVAFVFGQVLLRGDGGAGTTTERPLTMGDQLKARDVIRTAAAVRPRCVSPMARACWWRQKAKSALINC
jgi:hypothetical protein